MTNLQLKVKNINYEETITNMFPIIMKNINNIESDDPFVNFVKTLGDDSLPILLGVLSHLEEETKNQLLVKLANFILKDINNFIPEGYKELFTISSIIFSNTEQGIICDINNININYLNISNNETVQKFLNEKFGELSKIILIASKGLKLFPKAATKLEEQCISYMNNNKAKLTDQIIEILIKQGIYIDFYDFNFNNNPSLENVNSVFEIDKEIQNEVFGALAKYLKENIK